MFYIIHKLTLEGWFSLGSSSLLLLCRKLKFEDPDRYEFDLYLRKIYYQNISETGYELYCVLTMYSPFSW